MRGLVAVLALLVVIAAGWLFLLNGDPVAVRLLPGRTANPPLAGALLVAFGAGAVAAGLLVAARGASRWGERRRARWAARSAERTAAARDLLWTGAPARARATLLRAASGVPADVDRLTLLAETYLQEGDADGARALLEDGIGRLGYAPRLLDLLAEAAQRSGDLRAAVDALERARLVEPESPRLARRLRDVLVASARWEAALALQGELLLGRATGTAAADVALERGLRYEAARAETETDPRRAVRRLLALAREAPTFVPAWVSAGDVYAREGRTFLARRAWERGLKRRPALVLVERLTDLHTRAGRPERMTRLLRRLRRRHPDDAMLALALARQLLAQGALDEAMAALGDAGASPAADLLRGELERRRGNAVQAAELHARAAAGALGETAWRCTACRRPAAAWTAQCPVCRAWDTMAATIERDGSA
ncbi:MAG: lipopolysaccharide assembly protein LapA domain-containing protein [Candidatus Binatia bacterium]